MSIVDDPAAAAISAALDEVGPRLRTIRKQRGITLTDLASSTGISKSTLSRLENGQRRPTLELLLVLSHTYGVPLDDLVAAPEEGDPRIRLRAGGVKGRIVIPLTREPGGVQAWKIVIPTSKVTPEPRSHEGSEWIYVLSGHMRLVLGDQDSVLGPGDVANFDTQVPHWFGSTGDEPTEILSIYGRPGERMHVRVASGGGDNNFAESESLTDPSNSGGKFLEGEDAVYVDPGLPASAETGNRLEPGRPLLHGEHTD